LSHKLEVGERRSLASHYTLTTDEHPTYVQEHSTVYLRLPVLWLGKNTTNIHYCNIEKGQKKYMQLWAKTISNSSY